MYLVWGAVSARGESAPRGVSGPMGVCVSGPGGVCSRGVVSQHVLRQTPPSVDRITEAVKTLPWPNFVAASNKQMRRICVANSNWGHALSVGI